MLDKVLGVSDTAVECAGGSPHACDGGRQLDETARALSHFGPPVIVFSASHSGSRLLALMLDNLGVFMGSHLNDSEDSIDVFDLVRYLVEAYAPDYSKLKVVGVTRDVAESYAPLSITVSYAGQSGTPKPFLLIIDWIKIAKDWT